MKVVRNNLDGNMKNSRNNGNAGDNVYNIVPKILRFLLQLEIGQSLGIMGEF